MLKTLLKIEIKRVDDERKSLTAVFSTNDEDRHGDIVEQNWELDNFQANPVILNSHNYGDATEVVGRAENTRVENGQLVGDIVFAVEQNPKAKIVYELYRDGFLKAFSVGFIPKAFSDDGRILLSELLEVSAVSVPANQMALAKSAGIDVGALFPHNEDIKDLKSQVKTLETALSEFCETKKVETRHSSNDDRAEMKRQVNRSIRLLTKLKQRI